MSQCFLKKWNSSGSNKVCNALKEWFKPLKSEEGGKQEHEGASDGEVEGVESSIQSTSISETDTAASEQSVLTYFPPRSVAIEKRETATNGESGQESHAGENVPDGD